MSPAAKRLDALDSSGVVVQFMEEFLAIANKSRPNAVCSRARRPTIPSRTSFHDNPPSLMASVRFVRGGSYVRAMGQVDNVSRAGR